MAVLDANALTADAGGLAFLADVLGTAHEADLPGRRFPIEAWTPSPAQAALQGAMMQSVDAEARHVEMA